MQQILRAASKLARLEASDPWKFPGRSRIRSSMVVGFRSTRLVTGRGQPSLKNLHPLVV